MICTCGIYDRRYVSPGGHFQSHLQKAQNNRLCPWKTNRIDLTSVLPQALVEHDVQDDIENIRNQQEHTSTAANPSAPEEGRCHKCHNDEKRPVQLATRGSTLTGVSKAISPRLKSRKYSKVPT